MSQIPYLRHRGTFTTPTPARLDAVTAALAWFKVIIEVILYPKRSCTRRATPYRRATSSMPQIPYLRHHGTFTTHAPARLDAVTAALAWCRATIQTIMYAKTSTRRDTYYVVSACTRRIVVSPRRLPQHPVCRSPIRRVLVPFKASHYLPTGQLWTFITGTKVMLYVQCSVYVVIRSLADACEIGGLTEKVG